MPRICEVPECGEQITDTKGTHGGLPICHRCQSSLYYWRKKGPKAIRARDERLQFWRARLEYVQPRIARIVSRARERVREARARVTEG